MEQETITLEDVADMMKQAPMEEKVALLVAVMDQLWDEFDPESNRDAWSEITTARRHINYIAEFMEDN